MAAYFRIDLQFELRGDPDYLPDLEQRPEVGKVSYRAFRCAEPAIEHNSTALQSAGPMELPALF
jgi:hypothetical protein